MLKIKTMPNKKRALQGLEENLTSTAAVDPRHLKVEAAEDDSPDCCYVINRTCYCPMLIM